MLAPTEADGPTDYHATVRPDGMAADPAATTELKPVPEPANPAPTLIDPEQNLAQVLDSWSGISASVVDEPGPRPAEAGLPEVAQLGPSIPPGRTQPSAPGISSPAAPGMPADAKPDTAPDVALAAGDGEADPPNATDDAPAVPRVTERVGREQAVGPAAPARTALAELGSATRPELVLAATSVAETIEVPVRQLDHRPLTFHPPAILRQVADAVVTMKGDRLEIALSPEELGRVRLVVTGAERSAQVTVWVERPEVLELLRRNSGLLSEHFSDAGMSGAGFEFREEPRQDWPAGTAFEATDALEPAAETVLHVVASGSRPLSGERRLDVRL